MYRKRCPGRRRVGRGVTPSLSKMKGFCGDLKRKEDIKSVEVYRALSLSPAPHNLIYDLYLSYESGKGPGL